MYSPSPLNLNPTEEYVSPSLDFLRDLNFGYHALFSKKLVKADCRCRRHCCSGTEDTSLRKDNSSCFFHWVSALRVCE